MTYDRNERRPSPGEGGSEDERLQRALQREREDLPGQMEENRNVDGSTTWETLHEEERQPGDGDATEDDGR